MLAYDGFEDLASRVLRTLEGITARMSDTQAQKA